MEFKLTAKKGYIIMNLGSRQYKVGTFLKDAFEKAFNTADLISMGAIKGKDEIIVYRKNFKKGD